MADQEEELTVLRARMAVLEGGATRTRVVYSNRKLAKYEGSADQLEDWEREARFLLESQGLTGKAAGEFLLSALDGAAKKEVRFADRVTREDPEEIFKLLKESFQEKTSVAQLASCLFSRKQKDRESLRNFSHSLMEIADRIVSTDANALPNADKLLRDHFVDKLKDRYLKRELSKQVRDNPDLKFKDIREEAFLLSAEEDQGVAVVTKAVECEKENSLDEITSLLKQLTTQQQKQQEVIEKQQEQIHRLTERPQQTLYRQGPKQRLCYACGSPSHMIKDCTTKKNHDAQTKCQKTDMVGETLPSGLRNTVGERPVLCVKFDNETVECLVDTGSQVTTINEETYLRLWGSNAKELSEGHGLRLIAANGFDVPYLGVAHMDVEVAGVKVSDVGVLIVKSSHTYRSDHSKHVPGILGTNVLSRVPQFQCYSACNKQEATLDVMQSKGGFVRVAGVNKIVVPPLMSCNVPVLSKCCKGDAIVEPLQSSCPPTLRTAATLINLSSGSYCIPVTNIGQKEIRIG